MTDPHTRDAPPPLKTDPGPPPERPPSAPPPTPATDALPPAAGLPSVSARPAKAGEPGGPVPRRVVVASPRTRAARSLPQTEADETYAGPYTGPGWNIASDLDEQTELGAVFARTLIRAQLRVALFTGALVFLVVAALPLLEFVPGGTRARLFGLPLPWLVLAAGIQPLWIFAARRQTRLAEAAEHDFARLVGRP